MNVKCKYLTPFPRILVRAPNWIGDAVMAVPFLYAVRRGWPKAHLAVMAPPPVLEAVRRTARADSFLPDPARSPLALARILAGGRYDMAFNLTSSHRVASAMALARIPVRTGFAGGGRGMFMTSPVSPLARSRHQSVNYLSLAGGGGKAEPVRWTATAGDRAEAGAFLRKAGLKGRMVAFAPGAAYGPAKRWPDGSWAALADTLELEHGLGVVVVGGAAERSRAGAIAALTARKPVDATGCLSLGGTAALISRCAGFVSNDSGLMHVGATTGVPTVGIFGSSDPAWTAPHGRRCKALSRPVPCAPCFRRTCLPGRGYACLRAVQPASVISALSLLMRQG